MRAPAASGWEREALAKFGRLPESRRPLPMVILQPVRHERGQRGLLYVGSPFGVLLCGRCRIAGPLASPFGGDASSPHMLRWLKTVGITSMRKRRTYGLRQAGTGKASVSEPLLKCRNRF